MSSDYKVVARLSSSISLACMRIPCLSLSKPIVLWWLRPALLLVGDVTVDLVDGKKAVVRFFLFDSGCYVVPVFSELVHSRSYIHYTPSQNSPALFQCYCGETQLERSLFAS